MAYQEAKRVSPSQRRSSEFNGVLPLYEYAAALAGPTYAYRVSGSVFADVIRGSPYNPVLYNNATVVNASLALPASTNASDLAGPYACLGRLNTGDPSGGESVS